MDVKLSTGERNGTRRRVLELIREAGNISKPGIARELGLSLPTAIRYVDELLGEGVIKEGEAVGNTGGRKAKSYSINETYRYSIGIDLSVKKIWITLVDFCGNLVYEDQIDRGLVMDNSFYKDLGELVEAKIQDWEIDRESILGAGIAVPGLVTGDHQHMYYGKAVGVSGALARDVGRYLMYPCSLYNDSDAAGYAENVWLGGNVSAFYIRIGESVGGAVLIDGKVYEGENAKSGKIGHMMVVPGGKKCYCGRNGCLETVCNANVLREACKGDVKDFFEKLEQGDKTCIETWDQYLDYLAEAAANVRILFDSRIIIGGRYAEYIRPYFEQLIEKVRGLDTFDNPAGYMSLSSIGSYAPAFGSALLYLHESLKDF